MREKTKKIIACIVWILMCALVFGYFGYHKLFNYEVIDDFYLSIFSSGFIGEYGNNQIYTNIVFGTICKLLSLALPNIANWTIVLMLVGVEIGYSVLGILFIYKKGVITGLSMSVIFFVSTFYTMLWHFNFSKAGAFTMIIGTVVLTSLLCEEKSFKHPVIIGLLILFILFGSLFRIHTTISVVPFMGLCVLYTCWKKIKDSNLGKCIILWAGIFVCSLCLWGINYYSINNDSEWKTYKEYNEVLTTLLDFPSKPSWEDAKEMYQSLGWSENDNLMFQEWNYADTSFFSIERYNNLLNNSGNGTIRTPFWYVVYRLKVVGLDNLLVMMVLFIAVILLFILPEYQLLVLADVAFLGVEIVYLCYVGRYPERAVMIPIICSFVILLMIIAHTKSMSRRNNFLLVVMMFALSLCVSELYTFRNCDKYPYENREAKIEFLREISSRNDNLYVWSVVPANNCFLGAFSPIDPIEEGLFSNSVFAGGWGALTPPFNEKCSKYGDSTNVFKLLAENKNVYYVDVKEYSDSIITQYIREHYNENVECKLVEKINEYYIYSFCQ